MLPIPVKPLASLFFIKEIERFDNGHVVKGAGEFIVQLERILEGVTGFDWPAGPQKCDAIVIVIRCACRFDT